MKKIIGFLLLILNFSCQITETLVLNPDGSGVIETQAVRDENSYMQIAGENYNKENIFTDTTYVFKECIEKHNDNFVKYLPEEQALFNTYRNAKVHIKNSSFDKEFKTTITLAFQNANEIPDLYKIQEYADDIRNNYALSAEEHYYKIGYSFDGVTFNRKVQITDEAKFQKGKERIESYKKQSFRLNLTQDYILKYHFLKKIKSVSNSNAIISKDKKSISVTFLLSESLLNPESTNLEVVLENES